MTLSDREQIFLSMLIKGENDTAIAAVVGLTTGTVRVYLHAMYRKLGVRNRTQAAVWYLTKNNPDKRRKKK